MFRWLCGVGLLKPCLLLARRRRRAWCQPHLANARHVVAEVSPARAPIPLAGHLPLAVRILDSAAIASCRVSSVLEHRTLDLGLDEVGLLALLRHQSQFVRFLRVQVLHAVSGAGGVARARFILLEGRALNVRDQGRMHLGLGVAISLVSACRVGGIRWRYGRLLPLLL